MVDNALKTLFTDCANAIRETLPDVGMMSPNSFPDKIREVAQAGGGSGGDTSDLVKWVTFMSYDGNEELYKMPVLNGDTCKDPIPYRKIKYPPRYEDETNQYMHRCWVNTKGTFTTEDDSILKNITEDKTVYGLMTAIPKSIELTYDSSKGCYTAKYDTIYLSSAGTYYIEWDGTVYEYMSAHKWNGSALGGSVGISADISIGNPAIYGYISGSPITWTGSYYLSSVSKYPFFINKPREDSTFIDIYCASAGPHSFKICVQGQQNE